LESQIQRQRAVFLDLRRNLENEVAPLFADPGDAIDALLTNADAYGTDAAMRKLSLGLNHLSDPKDESAKASAELTARTEALLNQLMAEHGKLDLLNSEATRTNPSGPQRIFIQGQPFTLTAEARAEPMPEPLPEREAPEPHHPAKAGSGPTQPKKLHASTGNPDGEEDNDDMEPKV
jgi:hypothetical protein